MSIGNPQYEVFTGFSPYGTVGPYRAADYWELPEGERCELMRGRFIMSPSPTPLHQLILGQLHILFERAFGDSGDLVLLAPMDVVFSDDTVLQPDLLCVSTERKDIVKERVEGVPNLVVEILSPATGRRDKTEKLDLYAKYGVPEYWIVNPELQVFDFLLLKEGRYVVAQQPGNKYQSPLLPQVEIDLAAFWAEVEKRFPQGKRGEQ